jgi:hypothetical protein
VIAGDEDALDRLLKLEPGNVAALLRKADLKWNSGDKANAAAFYRIALKHAAEAMPLPLALKPAVERAQQRLSAATSSSGEHLENRLAAAGFPSGRRPARFQQSLDILFGRSDVALQLQRPQTYYFPGLPQRRYYERSEFDWVPGVEKAAGTIRAELSALLRSGGRDPFIPYIVSDPARPPLDFHGLVDNMDWSAIYLWQNGRPVPGMVDKCPATHRALSDLDLCRITTRAPSILFSRLRSGARIPPHTGMLNTRLICHLPLIVPEGCGFKVGGEVRRWREGELLIFDDTVEHEAWNESAQDRIVLIFDTWRPELGADERAAIVALFEALDSLEVK